MQIIMNANKVAIENLFGLVVLTNSSLYIC